ncbi:MAG: membrane dipeptidase [Pseudomonadales bacterium]|nr:membrane dipeptidase [Pseudomonadales bacterium]MCP5185248.1 membrane dipeptidase [Pseudomonadales bacterium]
MHHPDRGAGFRACLIACTLALCVPGHAVPDRGLLIVDTHIDAPIRQAMQPVDLGSETGDRQFDLPKARRGGLTAGFMSIFIPATVDAAGGGEAMANQLIDSVETLVSEHPRDLTLATCPNDVVQAGRRGLIALPMGLENGGFIGDDLNRLRALHMRGIRYLSLAHAKSNALADSSYDTKRPWKGISAAGQRVIHEMNLLGIMVDVSHLSDDAFWMVLDESAVPVIASHSATRHLVPGFERNIDDRMIAAIADAGGVVQVNVGSDFISAKAREYADRSTAAARAYATENGLDARAPEMQRFRDDWRAAHPYPYATLDDVVAHIDHVVHVAGINAVGIGSDFDGVGDTLPIGLKTVADYPNLVAALEQRGYSRRAIRKVMGENLLRVWRQVERYASLHATRPRCVL